MTKFERSLREVRDGLDELEREYDSLLKEKEDLQDEFDGLEQEKEGMLQTIYKDGQFLITTTLTKIRQKLNGN